MPELRPCLMTMFGGQADGQSIAKLNQLLDEGWRVAGINPWPRRLPGIVAVDAFVVELAKEPAETDEAGAAA